METLSRSAEESLTEGDSSRPHSLLASALFYALSLNLFLAFAGLSWFLTLYYNVGYGLHVLQFVIVSRHLHSTLWVLATLISTISAGISLIKLPPRGKIVLGTYCLILLYQLALFETGMEYYAFWLSLVSGVIFLVVTLFLSVKFRLGIPPQGAFMASVGFFAVAAMVEFYGLALRLIRVWYPAFGNSVYLISVNQTLQDDLSGFLFNYAPLFMLAILLVWIPLFPMVLKKPFSDAKIASSVDTNHEKHRGRSVISSIILLLALIFAVLIPLLPYLKYSYFRGVDFRFYYNWIAQHPNPFAAVQQLLREPRVAYLLLLYLIQSITSGDAFRAVIFGPSFLAVLFALTTYLLTRRLTGNSVVAGATALTAATTIHTGMGLFAGIFANWLGLSALTFFVYTMDRIASRPRFLGVIGALILSFLTVFIHAWSWVIIMLVLLFAVLLMLMRLPFDWREKNLRNALKAYLPVVTLSLLPAVVILMINDFRAIPESTEIYASGLNVARSISATHIAQVGSILPFTMYKYVGGLLAYPLILILALIGILSLVRSSIRTPSSCVMIAWLTAVSFGAMMLDSWWQWRLLYLIPFEVFAGLGVAYLLNVIDWTSVSYGFRSKHSGLVLGFKVLLVAVVLLDSVNYGLKAASLLPVS